MAYRIDAPTDINIAAAQGKTSLRSARSVSTLAVENIEAFEVGKSVLVGELGEETSFIADVAAITAGTRTLVLSAAPSGVPTTPKGATVRVLAFTHRRFYASDAKDGVYQLMTELPILPTAKSGTSYTHDSPTLPWLKVTYSAQFAESSLDDAPAFRADGSTEDEPRTRFGATISQAKYRARMLGNDLVGNERWVSAMATAESETAAAVASRYVMPLSFVPELLRDIVRDFAAGIVLIEEYGNAEDSDGARLLGGARKRLADIRDGNVRLLDGHDQDLPTLVPWPEPERMSVNFPNLPPVKMPKDRLY